MLDRVSVSLSTTTIISRLSNTAKSSALFEPVLHLERRPLILLPSYTPSPDDDVQVIKRRPLDGGCGKRSAY